MSIFDIFRTEPAVAPIVAQAPVSAPAPTQQASAAPATTTVPVTTTPPADEFADLWTIDPNTEKQDAPFSFNLNQEQLEATSKKLTIAPAIPQALQQRIAAGGQDAIAAMMEMQDITAQTVFARNAAATTALIEQAVQNTQSKMETLIDKRVKELGVRNSALELNTALNDPSVRPLVYTMQQRILQKFPNATQAEIAEKINAYFVKVGGILNPGPAQTAQQAANNKANADIDWAADLFN